MRSNNRALLLLSLIVASAPARADEVAVAAGVFDVLHHAHSADLRAEYQADAQWFGLHPMVGGMATTRGALWGGLGVALPLNLDTSWILQPTGLVGLYTRGKDKRLGAAVEFRPGIELAYRFTSGTLGVEFSHYSNAGLTAGNPGAESVVLRWAWRL